MVQVASQATQKDRSEFDLPNDGVATPTQQPTYTAGRMAVVDDQSTIRRITQKEAS